MTSKNWIHLVTFCEDHEVALIESDFGTYCPACSESDYVATPRGGE